MHRCCESTNPPARFLFSLSPANDWTPSRCWGKSLEKPCSGKERFPAAVVTPGQPLRKTRQRFCLHKHTTSAIRLCFHVCACVCVRVCSSECETHRRTGRERQVERVAIFSLPLQFLQRCAHCFHNPTLSSPVPRPLCVCVCTCVAESTVLLQHTRLLLR